ncbi:MAG: cyclophilin-like fold protein, partial [Gaiellaceae bacterium]
MMKIRLTVNGQHATATLADNSTARDFASVLPVTVQMRDLFDREKPGPLTRALDD